MKVLIASDIHGRIKATTQLECAIETIKPQKIILLGDFLYNGPRNGVPEDYDPMATCQILNKFKDKIIGIKGNCDARIDESLLMFTLFDEKVEKINDRRCILFHGDLETDLTKAPCEGDILISGHTHLYNLEVKNGITYLNPGSIGFPKQNRPATFAILDEKSIEIRDLYTLEIIEKL